MRVLFIPSTDPFLYTQTVGYKYNTQLTSTRCPPFPFSLASYEMKRSLQPAENVLDNLLRLGGTA
jgi:hypothetical protein